MSGGLSYYLDLVLLVLVLGLAVVNLPTLVREWNTPILTVIEDKTAVDTTGSIYRGEYEVPVGNEAYSKFNSYVIKTGADLLMALTVTDEMLPYPRAIKINDYDVIKLDNDWVVNKPTNLAAVYSTQLKDKLDWVIDEVVFVPADESGDPVNGPYWHYKLVER